MSFGLVRNSSTECTTVDKLPFGNTRMLYLAVAKSPRGQSIIKYLRTSCVSIDTPTALAVCGDHQIFNGKVSEVFETSRIVFLTTKYQELTSRELSPRSPPKIPEMLPPEYYLLSSSSSSSHDMRKDISRPIRLQTPFQKFFAGRAKLDREMQSSRRSAKRIQHLASRGTIMLMTLQTR